MPLFNSLKKAISAKGKEPQDDVIPELSVEPKESAASSSGAKENGPVDGAIARYGDGTSSSCKNHVYIAVMGISGTGKSTFISLSTGQKVKIGHGLSPGMTSMPCNDDMLMSFRYSIG